jgi:hypothetical protein
MKRGSAFLCVPIILLFLSTGFTSTQANAAKRKNPTEILKVIHAEVKELGFYENETFLRREFHMNLDGNDTNKEEYVMVFSQTIDGSEKMTVQVTYFEPQKDNSFIKHAVETKEIKCVLTGEQIEIRLCDYGEKEVRTVLTEILSGIRNKKKLLKLVQKTGF